MKGGLYFMDVVNVVTSIISSLGFPIAVCCWLFYDKVQERKARSEEMEAMRNAIESNTTIMAELKTMIATLHGVN